MPSSSILVSFRGEKFEFPLSDDFNHSREERRLHPNSTVGDLRMKIAERSTAALSPSDVKVIYKGKVLNDANAVLGTFLFTSRGNRTAGSKVFRFMATGVSKNESKTMAREMQEGVQKAKSLVKDDLTEAGQRRIQQRTVQGQRLLQKASIVAQRPQNIISSSSSRYGFDRVETLPNLPDEGKAREILTTLANDPGVKACMAKHRWKVGSLAELYPEGNVGETQVCVMGLNKNNGAQILLRIRTDDLKGFRKVLSIREVLYHELAHNVHSEHDGKFFQLMRQIKRECLELDWTQGQGTTTISDNVVSSTAFEGGTYRLGGEDHSLDQEGLSQRGLARRAAIRRLGNPQTPPPQCFDCRRENNLEKALAPDSEKEKDSRKD